MTDVLEIRDVSKQFISPRTKEVVQALDGVSMNVSQGEFVAIVGPSGCGKSTLLSIVAGIALATDGTVLNDNQPITGPSPKRGVMFQDYALFPWMTVRENIQFGPKALKQPEAEYKDVAEQLIKTVGLEGFGDRLPHELSGGMRQRCALARMLANNPGVWLMDEPLAAVDLQTRTLLQEELLRIWGEEKPRTERPAVLFVTHGIDEAVLMADRVVVLGRRPGQVKASIDIDLPRPRFSNRNLQREGELVEAIWELIRDEAAEAIIDE